VFWQILFVCVLCAVLKIVVLAWEHIRSRHLAIIAGLSAVVAGYYAEEQIGRIIDQSRIDKYVSQPCQKELHSAYPDGTGEEDGYERLSETCRTQVERLDQELVKDAWETHEYF
jgi:hypothetical protein